MGTPPGPQTTPTTQTPPALGCVNSKEPGPPLVNDTGSPPGAVGMTAGASPGPCCNRRSPPSAPGSGRTAAPPPARGLCPGRPAGRACKPRAPVLPAWGQSPVPGQCPGQLRVRTPGSKLGSRVCRGVTWGSGAGSRLRLRGTDGGWAASVVTERGSGPSLCRSRKRPRIDPEPEVSGPGAGIPSPGVPPGLRRGSGRAWWLTARAATACRHRLPPPPAATRCHCWEMHSLMAGRPAGEAQASLWLAGKKG